MRTESALVMLGSELLAAESPNSSHCLATASTGCASIDKALNGGFCYGRITSIAGPQGSSKSLIALHSIAGHLLATKRSEVSVIATTNSFDSTRLLDILIDRLSRAEATKSGESPGIVKVESRSDLQNEAMTLLSRVKFMRVFDHTGLSEGINEIIDGWESLDRELLAQKLRQRPREIASSQEEVEEPLDDGETVSLLGTTLEDTTGVGMIVIDDIASVFSREMSKNQVQVLWHTLIDQLKDMLH